MIRHIVMYKLRNDCCKTAAIQEIKNALEPLAAVIPGLNTMQIRPTLGGEFDYVLFSEFDSEADLQAYQTDARHLAVKPIVHQYVVQRFSADCLV